MPRKIRSQARQDTPGKIPYMGPIIKRQLNGEKHEIIDIDVDDSESIRALEADIAQRPDRYRFVEYLGVEFLVRLKDV